MSDSDSVARRRVFYIPGYDPIHPRRYRELYRKEGAAQAAISGYRLSLSPKTSGGAYGWHVEAEMDGARVAADVEVLVWSDIVRSSMSNSIPATYLQLWRTAWEYIATGALFRLMKLRKGPVIAALYPVGMLLLQLVLAVGAGWAIYALTSLLVPWLGLAARAAGGALGLAALWGLLRWFQRIDGKLFAYYLMHDYAYSARHRGANPPELETRMAQFGETIAAALREEVDEVLVIGHSSGAHLAVSILADLIRSGRVPDEGPKLAFLSLGQVVPMVSFLRGAWRLRADLAYLSTQDALTWVDVTAPGDGCAFALCDPVSVSGVAPAGKRWPLVFSAQFTRSLSPARWKELRWRFFRLHFQYLCAFDAPLDYDYFRITAGPQTLAQRYAQRPPSASRLEAPVNRFTSTSPDIPVRAA
ncbi:hypothetical protein [Alloyangia pacifica]|uniref:Uncharacterized protein n=1 Tax=Alloyangia pacifica TaxID=311180 RepID=A0A1I6P8U9_9RHOB|nr:hypothetical protein [Alloyangia pacifica]SDG22038.1 hypothetical protein SAMN04488245_10282 [Alloyangia pacifica]SFS36596.1 hypothetical protein SAMN04488050_101383 [Alloyangia pacifica]